MKRFICLLLAACLMLTACSAAAVQEESSEPEQSSSSSNEQQASLVKVINDYLVKAQYPEQVSYPGTIDYRDYTAYNKASEAWYKQREEQQQYMVDPSALLSYYGQTLKTFLTGEDPDKNIVVSPANLFMALALLAESTDTNTRAQILSVLGVNDIETLRKLANNFWMYNYHDDGSVTSILANSVWMDSSLSVKEDWLDHLTTEYFASAYSGEMGSDEMNEALRAWLNEQTGNKLEEAVQNVNLTPETLLALSSTIYYKARWYDEFNKNQTDEQIFHGVHHDQTCDMMHSSGTGFYYYGGQFGAIEKTLTNSGHMVFILPDEGVSPYDLLSDSEALTYMMTGEANNTHIMINLSIPKFDVTSEMELSDALKQLGIQDVFTGEADFTPVCDEQLVLDKIQHAARVTIDEEGVEAAAFTVELMAGGGLPPEEQVDFVLDRPFIFMIKGNDGSILFIGIVNQL